MVWQRVRMVVLAGAIVAVAAVPARADDCCAPAPCAPVTRKVCTTEWVPESYQCTRTVYRTESVPETYTAYRCESVPQTQTYTVTVMKRVPEVQTVTRTVCVQVPHVEQRTVMEKHYVCKPETHMERRCVDRGHYECREVPCHTHALRERLHKLCHRDCCEPCEPCPPPTKTVRVWVPCKVWEEYPVTKMVRVCEYVPRVCQVTVCRTETRQEQCQVTVCKCVPEQQTRTCTVMISRMVPYQATRMTCRCVPHQETVTMTRMVARVVEKEVPCCPAETVCCKPMCCKSRSWGHLLGGHHRGCCD